MIMSIRSTTGAALFRVSSVMALLVALLECGTPEPSPISYPCKNPDPRHFGPGGVPDPCHFEDPDSPAQAVKAFFGEVSGPFCAALYNCCADQMFLQDFAGGTPDACKTIWSDGTGLGSKTLLALKGSLVNGTTVFDGTSLGACVARLNERLMPTPAGSVSCVEPSSFTLLNTCFGAAFQGQIAPGDVCVPWPPVPEDLSFAECQHGRCETGKCASFLESGAPCYLGAYASDSPSTVCNFVQGEWCKGPDITGACAVRGEIGEACLYTNAAYECKSLACKGHICSPLAPTSSACDVF